MRLQKSALALARPRNSVVQALVRRILRALGRTHGAGIRRQLEFDRLDLDQRVREVGEW